METKNRVRKSRRMSTENLTMGAVLTALIVVLQLAAIGVKLIMPFLPFTFSLVLIPIVIGAAKCGPYMGGWLGFVFGVVVLLSGDANTFLVIDPVGTILTVLAKGFLCGFASGLVFRLIEKKQQTVELKEIQLSYRIDTHDFETKARHARRFLESGNKVRVVMRFRGREMSHMPMGREVMAKFCESVADVGVTDKPPVLDGRIISMVLAPAKNK